MADRRLPIGVALSGAQGGGEGASLLIGFDHEAGGSRPFGSGSECIGEGVLLFATRLGSLRPFGCDGFGIGGGDEEKVSSAADANVEEAAIFQCDGTVIGVGECGFIMLGSGACLACDTGCLLGAPYKKLAQFFV